MVKILDCTLRDGSYTVAFGFTAKFTKEVSCNLDHAGIDLIEIGHGIGLGASRSGKGKASATDEEYMRAGCGNWGMFCIPGIAELDDVRMLADNGAHFIRVGCEVNDVVDAIPFIELAKERGLLVFSNLMKSYTVTPKKFAKRAAVAVAAGADCVYVVDSAGSMSPTDLRGYFTDLRTACPDVKMGFHGHNNLGMAVANCLTAIHHGADVIDTTLLGIGRSGGNAPTDQFAAASWRTCLAEYDEKTIREIMRIGEHYIRPIVGGGAKSCIDVWCGLWGFHSSYLPLLERLAMQHDVDVLDLIETVSLTVESITEDGVAAIARAIHSNGDSRYKLHEHDMYVGGEQR